MVRGEGILRLRLEGAWVALLPGGRAAGEHQGVVLDAVVPEVLVKAPDPAVEVVGGLVGGQGPGPPVQLEPGPPDAVGAPAHQGPQVAVVLLLVFRRGIKAQADVPEPPRPVGDGRSLENGPVVQHLDIGPVGGLQAEEGHRRPLPGGPPGAGCDAHASPSGRTRTPPAGRTDRT